MVHAETDDGVVGIGRRGKAAARARRLNVKRHDLEGRGLELVGGGREQWRGAGGADDVAALEHELVGRRRKPGRRAGPTGQRVKRPRQGHQGGKVPAEVGHHDRLLYIDGARTDNLVPAAQHLDRLLAPVVDADSGGLHRHEELAAARAVAASRDVVLPPRRPAVKRDLAHGVAEPAVDLPERLGDAVVRQSVGASSRLRVAVAQVARLLGEADVHRHLHAADHDGHRFAGHCPTKQHERGGARADPAVLPAAALLGPQPRAVRVHGEEVDNLKRLARGPGSVVGHGRLGRACH